MAACLLVLASLIGTEAFAPPRHRKKNVALALFTLASLIGTEAFAPPRHRKKNVALALFTSDVETVGLVKSDAGVVIRRVAAEDDIGLGAFAGRPFEAGELLGEYVGERISADTMRLRYGETSGRYCLVVSAEDAVEFAIDAEDERCANWTRYCNHADGDGANLVAFLDEDDGGCVYLLAARDIAAGEELCFDYRRG